MGVNITIDFGAIVCIIGLIVLSILFWLEPIEEITIGIICLILLFVILGIVKGNGGN